MQKLLIVWTCYLFVISLYTIVLVDLLVLVVVGTLIVHGFGPIVVSF